MNVYLGDIFEAVLQTVFGYIVLANAKDVILRKSRLKF